MVIKDEKLYVALSNFMYEEAEFLDNREFDKWLNMLNTSFTYTVFLGNNKFGEEANTGVVLCEDDMERVILKLKRFETEFAWSEIPPSRTMRSISNIRIAEIKDSIIIANSHEIFYRNRNNTENEIIYCRRIDRIIVNEDNLSLISRKVNIESGVMPTRSLSLIL